MDIELYNGGGGGGGGNNNAAAVVSSLPNPADPRAKERQPFTWLRASPYIVGVLAGVALFAVGVARMGSHRSCSAAAAGAADDENRPASNTTGGGCDHGLMWYLLAVLGAALMVCAMYKASTSELVCGAPPA